MATRQERWLRYRAGLSFFNRLILAFTVDRLLQLRNALAALYIRGTGYEIGAQCSPLLCRKAGKISYIDYLTREESSYKYGLPVEDCVVVDLIADANDLSSIPAQSADFLIANHVLEHSPDPVASLTGWLRILKTGGTLFLSLPHYRCNEFDFEKQPVELSHLIQDHLDASRDVDIVSQHIKEHITLIDGIDETVDQELFERRRGDIVASGLHTHYHVFDRNAVFDLLGYIHQKTPVKIKNFIALSYGFELIFIIEKSGIDGTSQHVRGNYFVNSFLLTWQFILFVFNRLFRK
jgi:SAM-dependent methyltransferase